MQPGSPMTDQSDRGGARPSDRAGIRRVGRAAVSIAASLELTTIGLLWFFGLVLAGTFYQIGHPIYETTAKFFYAWFVFVGPVPLPAGQFVYAILGVNLIVSMVTRIPLRWSNVGLFVIHIGLIAMVVGGLAGRFSRSESVLVLAEGETGSYSQDLRKWDLVVGPGAEERHPLDAVPAEIRGIRVGVVSYIHDAVTSRDGPEGIVNVRGARSIARAEPSRPNPLPGAIVKIGAETVLLFGGDREPTTTASGLSLRLDPARYPLPVEIRLDDFTAEFFPRSNTPKAFTSTVTVLANGSERHAVITMNEPLRLRDYTVFQLGYDSGGAREVSVFQVVRNPLRWTVYAVSLVIAAGLLLHLAIRAGDVRRRRRV